MKTEEDGQFEGRLLSKGKQKGLVGERKRSSEEGGKKNMWMSLAKQKK